MVALPLPFILVSAALLAVEAGEAWVESPTFEHASIRWVVRGDADGDARVGVRVRERGALRWDDAPPLHRHHPLRDGNVFRGSLFGLEPGRDYDVDLQLRDPDGGEARWRGHFRTRSRAPAPAPTRILTAGPDDLRAVLAAARPGDRIELAPGHYAGQIRVPRGGSREAPLVITPAGEPGSVVVSGRILAGPKADYVRVENLEIHGRITGGRSTGWEIRRCRVLGGIATGFADWHVADNVLYGRYTDWRVRTGIPGGSGIHAIGRGHVLEHNEIAWYWDGISTNWPLLSPSWAADPAGLQHSIDIIGNDIYAAADDGIEADTFFGNVRIVGNRVSNSLVALSFQDENGGPLYAIGNELVGVHQAWKLHQSGNGLVIVHNTSASLWWGLSASPPDLRDAWIANNAIIGMMGVLRGGSDRAELQLRGNAYHSPPGTPFADWRIPGASAPRRFRQRQDLEAVLGGAPSGIDFDPRNDLRRFEAPQAREDFDVRRADFRPRPESRLAGSADRFEGDPRASLTRADIGALAVNGPPPHYGPRPISAEQNWPREWHRPPPPPLTLRETILRFLDVHQVPAGLVLVLGMLVAFLSGVAATLVALRLRSTL